MQLTLPFLTTLERPARPAAGSEPTAVEPTAVDPTAVEPADPPAPATVFIRNPNARRYILRMRPDGTLRVTIPRRGSKREAEAFIVRQRRWIERERQRVGDVHGPREWGDGSTFLLDGVAVGLVVSPRPDGRRIAAYAGRQVSIGAGQSVRAAVEADLGCLAAVRLPARLRELAAAQGLTPGRVTIRNQRSRWGSCTAAGNIALNFRLVQMPAEVRDYVLLHELMHLKEQNHSRRFWRLVAAVCPGFREAERWLRTGGRSLF